MDLVKVTESKESGRLKSILSRGTLVKQQSAYGQTQNSQKNNTTSGSDQIKGVSPAMENAAVSYSEQFRELSRAEQLRKVHSLHQNMEAALHAFHSIRML